MRDIDPHWVSCGMSNTDQPYYRIEDQRGEVVDIDGSFAKLVVFVDDVDSVRFALFEWSCSNADDTNRQFHMIFHGVGVGGGLRECRHTYWGEAGYVYLMPLDVVAKAMAALRKWFDA